MTTPHKFFEARLAAMPEAELGVQHAAAFAALKSEHPYTRAVAEYWFPRYAYALRMLPTKAARIGTCSSFYATDHRGPLDGQGCGRIPCAC
jgi:hypothetical protein